MARLTAIFAITGCLMFIAGCQSAPEPHVYPHDRFGRHDPYVTMSDDELIALLAKREHQLRYHLPVESTWSIHETGGGGSLAMIQAAESRSFMIERHMVPRLRKNPDLLLHALAARDPDVVLTVMFAYDRAFSIRIPAHRQMPATATQRLIDTIREHCFTHRDLRVRIMATQLLVVNGFGEYTTVDDMATLLQDRSASIRSAAAWALRQHLLDQVLVNAEGEAFRPTLEQRRQWFAQRREMIPLIIEHLNDPDTGVRFRLGDAVRHAFYRDQVRPGGRRSREIAPGLPEQFDWTKASWQDRVDNQATWVQWWDDHGEAALVWAHGLEQPQAPRQ